MAARPQMTWTEEMLRSSWQFLTKEMQSPVGISALLPPTHPHVVGLPPTWQNDVPEAQHGVATHFSGQAHVRHPQKHGQALIQAATLGNLRGRRWCWCSMGLLLWLGRQVDGLPPSLQPSPSLPPPFPLPSSLSPSLPHSSGGAPGLSPLSHFHHGPPPIQPLTSTMTDLPPPNSMGWMKTQNTSYVNVSGSRMHATCRNGGVEV